MKSVRFIVTMVAVVLLWSTAVASPVSPARAARVAKSFFGMLNGTKGEVRLAEGNVAWQYEGMYLFVGEKGGFVLVAADDAARPILGYSSTGRMDIDNVPPQLQEWLQGYARVMKALGESKASTTPEYAEEWYALEHGTAVATETKDAVEPMLTTFWDQTYPYNGYCPGGTVTGCAATAQAQVMNYWKFPIFGKGSHSYVHRRYGEQKADFGKTLYDWEHMPSMAGVRSTDEEKNAVATLMYHCGVSLDMDYGTAAQGGSSALGLVGEPGYASIDNALKDYFCYKPTLRVRHRDYGFTNESWRDTLIAELDLGHPIVYAGSGEQGGHGFVCDGYDERGYLHFNFGWSGIGDGYFPVDSISPGIGGVGGNVTYTFNMSNSALLGLEPDYRMRVSDTLFSLMRDGGADSLLFCTNQKMGTEWMMTCDADWLMVNVDSLGGAARIRFSADANASGQERVAVLQFHQGDSVCEVRVVQSEYAPEELCPLNVVMESTRGNGWTSGAYLSFESENGLVFGVASLQSGSKDSVQVPVGHHHVYVVWHGAGGTDRYVNYEVKNVYGESMVNVRYAYRNGGRHHIEWPCARLGIDSTPAQTGNEVVMYPNPVTDRLNITAEGVKKVELMTIDGRLAVVSYDNYVDMGHLPAGAYFVKVVTGDSTIVRRVVKR